MYKKNKIYVLHYLLAFLIASFLFTLIFLFTYSVSYINYSDISDQNNYISDSILRLQSAIKNNQCATDLLLNASVRLDIVGSRISLLESRFGKTDERVLEQKK